jgi:large subunit ribosomal protein L30
MPATKKRKMIRLKQIRSGVGAPREMRDALKTLGLEKLYKFSELPDTREVRSMIAKVPHLVSILDGPDILFPREKSTLERNESSRPSRQFARHGSRDGGAPATERAIIPGSKAMQSKYATFRTMELPAICERFELDISALTFADFLFAVAYSLAPAVTPATG